MKKKKRNFVAFNHLDRGTAGKTEHLRLWQKDLHKDFGEARRALLSSTRSRTVTTPRSRASERECTRLVTHSRLARHHSV